jgi:hypothetical protein
MNLGAIAAIQHAKLPRTQRGRSGALNVHARVVGLSRLVDVAPLVQCGRRGTLGAKSVGRGRRGE